MSALCGWLGTGAAANGDALERMAAALPLDGGERACGEGWGLAAGGPVHHGPGIAAALVGAVEFADRRLQVRAREGGAAAALAAAYSEQGESCLALLRGAFAAAVVDHAARSVLLAIDRMGVHSICYAVNEGTLVFGSSADAVRAHPAVASGLSLQSVFNYVYFHMVPGPETIYRGLRRIPPGGFVRFAGGALAVGSYWRIAFREAERPDVTHLETEFRALLERGVAKFVDGRPIGAFLSGGTDSSTVAGMLGRTGDRAAKTYSIGFDAQGYDEMAYARIAAKHFRTEHHEYYVTPDDVLELIQRLTRFCDQPFGNSSAVPTYYCARMAREDGVELLLGGDGGDELFGGNERYAKQAVFALYDRVPRALRRGLLEPALFAVPRGERLPLLRKARSYVQQASVPMPGRLQTYNLLNRIPLERIFTDEFLGHVDPATPGRLLDGVYHGAEAGTMLNRMLALDLRFTLADNDLYKVNRMCELAGVAVAYPMLDDDLVAFSAALPSGLKLRRTTLRYFFKRALRGFLPPEIIAKRKHGFGLPTGVWLHSHAPLRELAYDALDGFKARGVMRAAFVDELVAEHQGGHAGYWGEQIWVLGVLELWLRAHGLPRGQALV